MMYKVVISTDYESRYTGINSGEYANYEGPWRNSKDAALKEMAETMLVGALNQTGYPETESDVGKTKTWAVWMESKDVPDPYDGKPSKFEFGFRGMAYKGKHWSELEDHMFAIRSFINAKAYRKGVG